MTKPGDILANGQYSIIRIRRRRPHCEIALAKDTACGEERAIKISPLFDSYGVNRHVQAELIALRSLQSKGCDVIPFLYNQWNTQTTSYLVLDHLNENLAELKYHSDYHKYKLPTAVQLTYHILKALEAIHGFGVLHRNINLENYMLKARNGTGKVYLVGFGRAIAFKNSSTGARIPMAPIDLGEYDGFYSPPKVYGGLPYLETEDLVSAAYSITGMRAATPWSSEMKDHQEMLERKIEFGRHPEKVFEDQDQILAPIVKELCLQEYGKTPQYNSIMNRVTSTLKACNVTPRLETKVVYGYLRIV